MAPMTKKRGGPKSRATLTALPAAAAAATEPRRGTTTEPPTGSPLGWTFWSYTTCWFRWAQRYILGLHGPKKSHFALGSVYHALLEGVPEETIISWGVEFESQLSDAKRLYRARLDRGPPMGEPLYLERTLGVPNIPMTSKPDREEKTVGVREFKTSGWHGRYDAEGWAIHGGMLGELIASGRDKGVVDVIDKSNGSTTIYPVEVTPRKKLALESLIRSLARELRARLTLVVTRGAPPRPLSQLHEAFPRDLRHCVTRFGPCEYYARCWGSVLDGMVYRTGPVTNWWKNFGLAESLLGDVRTKLKGYDKENHG